MRVLCAPDSFKGSLSAEAAARAMALGLADFDPRIAAELCPIADGGEGSLDTILQACGGTRHQLEVCDPLGNPRSASWGALDHPVLGSCAVVEMAQASGLTLVPPAQRNPFQTTSFGTGQLIAAALEAGSRQVLLFVGGSATHDGGCGAAQALGVRFLDTQNQAIPTPLRGADLVRVARIDLGPRHPGLARCRLWICCDVRNPLLGAAGAARVFATQKGASTGQLPKLDADLAQLAELWHDRLGQDVRAVAGAGAAGGMGGGAMAMLGGRIRSGTELVLDLVDLDQKLATAQLCITGEGRFDSQSASGKACQGVAARANAAGVPCIGVFGSMAAEAPDAKQFGFSQVLHLCEDSDPEASMREASTRVRAAVRTALDRHHKTDHRGPT